MVAWVFLRISNHLVTCYFVQIFYRAFLIGIYIHLSNIFAYTFKEHDKL